MTVHQPLPGTLARQPHMIGGMRGAHEVPDTGLTMTAVVLPEIQPGNRLFRSKYRRYRLHLGKRPDGYDNTTGKKIKGFEFTAIFSEYAIALPAYFESHAVPEEEREEFIRRLETHRAKGIDYEDVSILKAALAAQEEESARDILARNPELRKKLAQEESQAKGFELPPPPAEEADADDGWEGKRSKRSRP